MSPLDLVLAVKQMNAIALKKLAEDSDVPFPTLWNIRHGDNKRGPTMETLQKLWETMDANPEYTAFVSGGQLRGMAP